MIKRTRMCGFVFVALLLMPLTGCSGGDSTDGDKAEADAEAALVGSFVGKVAGTEALVAVVALPPNDAKDSGSVQIYLTDGGGLSESLSGSISDDRFTAVSEDGEVETEGKLTADSATGTVVLPGGKEASYEATTPSGAAGLYELKVSSVGELSGASAAGLNVTGQVTLEKQGTGTLRLVDGKRLELTVTRSRAGDLSQLPDQQVRLIILSDGEVRGVAMGRPSESGRSGFFIRSA